MNSFNREQQAGLAGGCPEFAAFEPEAHAAGGPARVPAAQSWARLAGLASVSKALRAVAAELAQRLRW